MHKPDRDEQIGWLFQNSESADKRLLGSRPARPHRARHLLNVLAYEPRASAAILAFLCVAVIVMSAFPSFWKNGHSSESKAVPTKLSSLSAEPALTNSTAVHTARSASISSDRNQPYGMLQGAAPDNGPGESLRFSVPSNDLAAPSSLAALPVAKSIADGLLRIGLHQAQAEAEGSPAATTSSSAMVAAADPSTTPDVSSVSIRGVSDKEIRFGIVGPFSGPAKELGRQMKIGIETVFSLVNEGGAVNGRQLKLFSADDGYEPTR